MTINIGTPRYVAHDKNTVTNAISGAHTERFKNWLERNISINLGYEKANIYKVDKTKYGKDATAKVRMNIMTRTMTMKEEEGGGGGQKG